MNIPFTGGCTEPRVTQIPHCTLDLDALVRILDRKLLVKDR
jgi:hypothetical protein